MSVVTESDMEKLKLRLITSVADGAEKGHRIKDVAEFMQCDEPEARRLILHGRRLERRKGGDR